MSEVDGGALLAALWMAVADDASPLPLRLDHPTRVVITADTPLAHTLTLDAPYTEGAIRGQRFRLAAPPPGPLTIELRAHLFDGYLVVRRAGSDGAEGELLAEDDDGWLRSHPRIVLELTVEQAAAAAEPGAGLEIVAVALNGGLGECELVARAGPPAELDAAALAAAELADLRAELAVREAAFGATDARTLATLETLAVALETQPASDGEELRQIRERLATALSVPLLLAEQSVQQLYLQATAFESRGRHGDAIPLRRELVERDERRFGRDHPETLSSLVDLGDALKGAGRLDEASQIAERVLASCEAANPRNEAFLATALNSLALLRIATERDDEAIVLLERALAVASASHGERHAETATIAWNLGQQLVGQGRDEEAASCFARSLAARESLPGFGDESTVRTLLAFGKSLRTAGRLVEARAAFERALPLCEALPAPAEALIATAEHALADALEAEGRHLEARPHYERAFALRRQHLAPDDLETDLSAVMLANLLIGHLDEPAASADVFEWVVASQSRRAGPDAELTLKFALALARVHYRIGRLAEGRAGFERLLAHRERAHGADSVEVARLLAEHGMLAGRSREDAAAVALLERALPLLERHLGADHPDTVSACSDLAVACANRGEHARATTLMERVVRARTATTGDDDLLVDALFNLANCHLEQGRTVEVQPLLDRALAVAEGRHGAESLKVAQVLTAVATLRGLESRHLEEEELWRRAFEIRKERLEPEHLDVVWTMQGIGGALASQRRFDEAIEWKSEALRLARGDTGTLAARLLEMELGLARTLHKAGQWTEAWRIVEASLPALAARHGPRHPNVADAHHLLGEIADSQGRFDAAHSAYSTALAIREEVLAPDDFDLALSLAAVANGSSGIDRVNARSMLERALAIARRSRGAGSRDEAACLSNLAQLLREDGRLSESLALQQESLAIQIDVEGAESFDVAVQRSNIGILLKRLGRLEEACRELERSLEVRRRLHGRSDLTDIPVARALAEAQLQRGRSSEAEALLRQLLRDAEAQLGVEHAEVAHLLSSLGSALMSTGRIDEALQCLERAAAISEQLYGTWSTQVASDRGMLSRALRELGRLDDAAHECEQAVAIYEHVEGRDHLQTARMLTTLALVRRKQGRHAEVRTLHERAEAVFRAVYGPDHSELLNLRTAQTMEALDGGDRARAAELAVTRFTATADRVRREADFAPEEVVRQLAGDLVDAFALRCSVVEPAARGDDTLLSDAIRSRGESFRLLGRRRGAADDPATRELGLQLQSVSSALSNLLGGMAPGDPTERDLVIRRLRGEREALERQLAAKFASDGTTASIDVESLRAALPADAALVVMVERREYVPERTDADQVVVDETFSAPAVAAWVVRAGAPTTYVDLGPSAELEFAVREHLNAVVGAAAAGSVGPGVRGAVAAAGADPSRSASRATTAAQLRERVWEPLAPHLAGAHHVIVAPDGPLTTLPLAIIEQPDGRLLIETHAFSLVEDVTAMLRPRPAAQPDAPPPALLVVGAVDYARGDASEPPPIAAGASPELRGSFTATWPVLPFTADEVQGIAEVHRARFRAASQTVLTGDQPTEERLKRELASHDVIHLATHGYFLVDGMPSVRAGRADAEMLAAPSHDETELVVGYWPQFLCGLVCAGANDPPSEGDNGLLTGDEASRYDVSRCDLVVLSACETALGRREAGEGMLSLTHSFRSAGARTVLSGLWQVRDDSTKELMLDFYDRLWNRGESKLDALRGAQLAMLKKNREKYGDTLPATWGAFVLTGETE